MLTLIINICLAVLPALFFMYLLSRTGISVSRLYKPLLIGYLFVLPAAGIEYLLVKVFSGTSGTLRLLVSSFIIAALTEEFFKYLPIRLISRKFEKPREIIEVSVLTGLGFALFENLNYVLESSETIMLRSVTAVPLHGMCAAIIGFGVALKGIRPKTGHLFYFLIAIVFHGVYDLALFSFSGVSYLVLPALLLQFFIVRRLYLTSCRYST